MRNQFVACLALGVAFSVAIGQGATAKTDTSALAFLKGVYAKYQTGKRPDPRTILTPQFYRALRTALDSGKVDWDVICNCQDSEGIVAQINMGAVAGNKASAQVKYGSKAVQLFLVHSPQGWRIADAKESGLTMSTHLRFKP